MTEPEELSDKFVSDTADLEFAPAPFWMLRKVFSAEELAAKYSAGELTAEQAADFEKHYDIPQNLKLPR